MTKALGEQAESGAKVAGFEDRLTALEAVVERLERGELSLEDSVRLFEQGVDLSNKLKLELEKAEGRIQVLVETRSGTMKISDFDNAENESEIEPRSSRAPNQS
jgi:exodeoxyribonuclease VII small subunit